jgi:hypothetical protein
MKNYDIAIATFGSTIRIHNTDVEQGNSLSALIPTDQLTHRDWAVKALIIMTADFLN